MMSALRVALSLLAVIAAFAAGGSSVLRPATVIPAATAAPTVSKAAGATFFMSSEPDQWRTGGSPAPWHGNRRYVASWYDAGHGLYAAMPGMDRPSLVVVTAFPGGQAVSVTLPVVTTCGCPGGRAIDLSIDAVKRLGLDPLIGLYRVVVEEVR